MGISIAIHTFSSEHMENLNAVVYIDIPFESCQTGSEKYHEPFERNEQQYHLEVVIESKSKFHYPLNLSMYRT